MDYSIIGTDADGLITVFNQGAERMLGYDAGEMIGRRTPADIHDSGEVAARAAELGIEPGVEVFVSAARAGQSETREWTYVRRDGGTVSVELTVSAIRDGHGEVTGFIGVASDVTSRRQAERAALESEQALKIVSEVTRDVAVSDDARESICSGAREVGQADLAMLLEYDGDGQLVMTACSGADPGAVAIKLGGEASGAAVAFTSGQRFFVPDAVDHPAVSQRLREALGIASVVFEPIRDEDRPIGVLVTGWSQPTTTLEGAVGSALSLFALEAGVALERYDMLQRLEKMARTDGLTGLLNRRAWDDALAREASRARRSRDPMCIALIDLDHFKDFNDEFGHQAGDRLLKAAAAAWRSALRDVDLIARYGGEEFAVLLPDCRLDEAHSVLERVRAATPSGITCSAGVAEWDMAEKVDRLAGRADHALYQAKESGRDRVVLASPVADGDRI